MVQLLQLFTARIAAVDRAQIPLLGFGFLFSNTFCCAFGNRSRPAVSPVDRLVIKKKKEGPVVAVIHR